MFYIPKTIAKKFLQFIKDELVGFAKMGSTFVTKWNGSNKLINNIIFINSISSINLDQL
jgi:hypothetical protein